MINTIEHNGNIYPAFQANGNAARFCMPFAMEVCTGTGFDIGYCKEEWKLPHAIGIEPAIDNRFDAMNLPDIKVDFVMSSHVLEHIPNWSGALNYWMTFLKKGGTLFLYLPDFSQTYWNSWNNKKHIHNFEPHILRRFLIDSGNFKNIFVSGVDAYNSFICMAEKI